MNNKTITIHALNVIIIGLTILLLSAKPALAQSPTTNQNPSTNPNVGVNTCVKEVLGDRYQQVRTGEIKAEDLSETEINAIEACFAKSQPKNELSSQPKDDPARFDKMAPRTKQCLEQKLGSEWQAKMQTMDKVQGKAAGIHVCFGAQAIKDQSNIDPGDQGQDNELPAEVRSCIVKTVGQSEADEIFAGTLPDGSVADKIEQAGCFANFGHGSKGDQKGSPPQMSEEGLACFKKVSGGKTPEQRPRLTKAQMEQLRTDCFKGGSGGPEGPDSAKYKQMGDCMKRAGFDVREAAKGAGSGIISDGEKEAAQKCMKEIGFQPVGPGQPNEGQHRIDPEKERCVKEIGGDFSPGKQIDPETAKKINEKCFGGQGPANLREPERQNRPQGFEKCQQELGFRPEPGSDQSKIDRFRGCVEKNGGFEQSPNNQVPQPQQQNNRPNVSMSEETKSCASANGINLPADGSPPDPQTQQRLQEKCLTPVQPQNGNPPLPQNSNLPPQNFTPPNQEPVNPPPQNSPEQSSQPPPSNN